MTLVNPDFTMLSDVQQEQVIRKFLPSELIPAGWSCQNRSLTENIQSLYKDSNKRIQMYGSPENLEVSLMNFMSFPGNQQFFQFYDSASYKTYVSMYQSLGNISHIYRKDMYDVLFEYIPKFKTLPPLQKLAYSLVGYYLRIRKNQLENSHEMIAFNNIFIHRLVESNKYFEMIMAKNQWKEYKTIFPFDPKGTGQVLDCISKTLSECDVKIESAMQEMITKVTKDVPVEKKVSEYKKVLTYLEITIKSFDKLINKSEMMMFSRTKTVDSISISKIPIRLFESDGEKVVMSHELLHAIKLEKLDVSGFEEKILAMPKLSAMSFREVFQMIPSNIFKMLEFVKIPLTGGWNEPTIIPMIDGNYCLTTYQFFMVILNDLILVKKTFQGMKRDQWSSIMGERYNMLMDTLKRESYFMTYETFEQTKMLFGTWFKINFPSPNQKEISEVNKNGFTNDDLNVQLERLELTEVFPGIENTVDDLSQVNPPTNGCSYEATKQMFECVQDSQYAYVLDYSPEQLIKILHERKWCGKPVFKSCPICSKEHDEPSVKATEVSEVSAEHEAVDEKKNLLETAAGSSDASSSDETPESSSTQKSDDLNDHLLSSATVEPIVLEKQVPIQKPKKVKKKNEKPAVKPEVKESQACPKCIRASEYTVKTNEKLRLSKIEVKHLRKELSEVQKLRKKEDQMSLKNSEVELLSTKKQELEQKNERNERLISTFHEVIFKKDVAIKSLQCHNHEKDKVIEELKLNEYKAAPPRSVEESEKVDSLLSNLLETKNIILKEDPLKKSSDICDSMIFKVNSKVTQQLVKYETKVFQFQVSFYSQIVESNIRLIRGNHPIKLDQIPEIPDFPEFSEEFKNVHKSVMKKEAPLLCRQLLKLTDEIADMECVICITDMESHDETTKCGHCKRRYHNHCIKSWLKKKSICPTCKHGMVDEQEFPSL